MSAESTPCHRLAVVPGVSGIDTATVTTGLALALASVQDSDVLLLDLDSSVGVLEPGVDLKSRFGLLRATPGAVLPVAPRLSFHAGATVADLARDWSNHCGIMLVHSGPGPDPALLDAALDNTDTVLLFTPDTGSGVSSALGALGWLRDQERKELADGVIVVLAGGDAEDTGVYGLATTLEQHCRAVRRLPADVCAMPPGVLDPLELPETARLALLELAGTIAAAVQEDALSRPVHT